MRTYKRADDSEDRRSEDLRAEEDLGQVRLLVADADWAEVVLVRKRAGVHDGLEIDFWLRRKK